MMGLAQCLAGDIEPMSKLAQDLDLGLEVALELLIELQDTRSLYYCLALRLSKAEMFSGFPISQYWSLEKDSF
jgi:hypothetical protein